MDDLGVPRYHYFWKHLHGFDWAADFTRCIRCRAHRGPWLWCRLGSWMNPPWSMMVMIRLMVPRFLGESWGYPPSKLCSVSSLDSWNLEFCGFLFCEKFSGGDNLLKIHGNWENLFTPRAEQEPLGDWGFKGSAVVSFVFFVCQSSKGLNHKNAMEMTVQDFPRLKWIIHRPTLRQVLRLLKQEDPGGLLTPCFCFCST